MAESIESICIDLFFPGMFFKLTHEFIMTLPYLAPGFRVRVRPRVRVGVREVMVQVGCFE